MKCLVIFLSLLSVVAVADTPTAVSEAIIKKIKSVRVDVKIGEITPSPVPGLYAVPIQGGPTIYATTDGKYFFGGDLFRVGKGRFVNLREEAKSKERQAALSAVSEKDLVIFSPKGETKGVVNIFTDVDCTYCRKFHQQISDLNDVGIEIRYLAFPREGLESSSYRRIASAWCARDKQLAVTALKNGENIEENVCENNPVASQYKLGLKVGVMGTPAMVLQDGSLLQGYHTVEQLTKILDIKI